MRFIPLRYLRKGEGWEETEWKEIPRSLSGVNSLGKSSREKANSKAFGFREAKTFLTVEQILLF